MGRQLARQLAGTSKDFRGAALPKKAHLGPGSFTSGEGRKCQPLGPSQNTSREWDVAARPHGQKQLHLSEPQFAHL